MNAHKIQHISELVESCQFEAKAAQGRHGRGELPRSLWETISGFANTSGGWIVLGVTEAQDHSLTPIGVQEPQRMIDELWQALIKDELITPAILAPQDIFTLQQDDLSVIVIHVPKAAPIDRPVYVGKDPNTGTYIRRGDGDYRCTKRQVELMQQRAQQAKAQATLVMTAPQQEQLERLASHALQSQPPDLDALIIELCQHHALTATQLAKLTQLERSRLKSKHLLPLIQADKLRYLYPDRLTHPGQRYCGVKRE